MKRLAPGVSIDNDGVLHIALGELLADNGHADTPANRALLMDAWRERCAARGIALFEVDP